MAGGITGTHVEGEADPAGDANAQDNMLVNLQQSVNVLLANLPQFRDLGAGPVFPTTGLDGSGLLDNDAFDLG